MNPILSIGLFYRRKILIIYAKEGENIFIAREKENLAVKIIFNISDWIEDYGDGTLSLSIKQNNNIREKNLSIQNQEAIWNITLEDSLSAEKGMCQLTYTSLNGAIKKSSIYNIFVKDSLN